MRLVFFGTPEYAVATLERLLAGPHDVVGVVSQPDRRRGRGRALAPSPVSARALEAGVALLRPERVGESEVVEALAALRPDLGVVVAFGQFLPKRVRELPARGYLVNGHASLLPRHRGAAPIAWAILAGDLETGVSVMRVEREMDAGPVALERRTPIESDESAGRLADRLAEITADAIAVVLDEVAAGRATWTPQDDAAATLAPKITGADARLDWNDDAPGLVRRVRAMAPSPGAWTEHAGQRLRILAARVEPGAPAAAPGTVSRTAEGLLRIATGHGWLAPLELQRPGKRALTVEAFLRGNPIADGERLGASAPSG